MPVSLGAAVHTFADPIGMMTDCHRRIERFLRTLQVVADEKGGQSLDTEYREAFERALDYFRGAAPKHTADEEEDLFPVLQGMEEAAAAGLGSRILKLQADHGQVERWHRECDEIGHRWLRDGTLSPRDTARLREVLPSLAELYRAHIEMEERDVFPLAQKALSATQKAAIGRSMAQRRGIGRGDPG